MSLCSAGKGFSRPTTSDLPEEAVGGGVGSEGGPPDLMGESPEMELLRANLKSNGDIGNTLGTKRAVTFPCHAGLYII